MAERIKKKRSAYKSAVTKLIRDFNEKVWKEDYSELSIIMDTLHSRMEQINQSILSHGWPATPGHHQPPLIHNSRICDRKIDEF